MPETEENIGRLKTSFGAPGKNARRSSRWILPRPPLRNFTTEIGKIKTKNTRPSASCLQRVSADFSGASPVASALGVHVRRDPGMDQINVSWAVVANAQNRNFLFCSKAELSTLP
jgi:hypothetical protein